MANTRIKDNWIRTIITGDGEKFTFCGALEKRYGHISAHWNDETRKKYEREYNDIILPALEDHNSKAIDEYEKADYESAIARIREKGFLQSGIKRQYSESTIHHFQNLMYFVVFHSSVYGLCENVLKGSTFSIDIIGEDEEKEFRVQMKKSLTVEQEINLSKELLLDPYESGSNIALLLMWGLGLRNAEACGLNYCDIKPIENHSECFAAWIYKTTKIESNQLQSGGKTYNTGRIVPVPERIISFLFTRKERIKQIINDRKLDADVEDLPICCDGYIDDDTDALLTRCKAKDVTKAAHSVFDKVGVSSKQIAYLDAELADGDTASILKEKEPTAYLLRRNYATQMCILGLTNAEMQYLMGHDVEDAYESRNEFVDSERIYAMHCKLRFRSLLNNSEDSSNTVQIRVSSKSTVGVHAVALEPTDKITVRIESKDPAMVQTKWFENNHDEAFDRTVNNLEQYQMSYQSSTSSGISD